MSDRAIKAGIKDLREKQEIITEQTDRIETLTNRLEHQTKKSFWITVIATVATISALVISLLNLFA